MRGLTESRHMTARTEPSAVARLRRTLRGEIVLPGDSGYEDARRVWNGMVDRRPAIIAYCTGADDVAETVSFARSYDLQLSVRGGGHSIAGASVCDQGVVIDLSRMKAITVDPQRRTARAEAGLNLGEFDAETQAFGLATTMGLNSDTGIAGLTLGGGLGRLGRRYGLACDNLLAADVVTADGRLLCATATENPDLFWGLRGGGGNFGIVTALEYRLHPVGPTVLGGSLIHAYPQAGDALRSYADFCSHAPDEVSADAVLLTAPSGERLLAISLCHSGAVDEGERALEPLRAHGAPFEDGVAPVSYVQLQSSKDSLFARGRRYFWKAQFLTELTDDAIGTLLEAYAKAPSAASLAVLQQVGGAIAWVPPSETAYGNRDAAWDCFPIAIWDDPADDEANIDWARSLWEAMRPFSSGGVYVNNLGDEGEDRVLAAYGLNYERLAQLKTRFDPGNLFRGNQNIRPVV
jgi:FAD/FMN-containing dehydrogenase